MADSSGLTRRRGGGGGANAAPTTDGEDRVKSPPPNRSSVPETSYESSANGHKIAFDPRDISESAERIKQPKLTLMEEVLLLGLKDKQVCHFGGPSFVKNPLITGVLNKHADLIRVYYRFGTTISLMLCEDASSSNSPSEDASQ